MVTPRTNIRLVIMSTAVSKAAPVTLERKVARAISPSTPSTMEANWNSSPPATSPCAPPKQRAANMARPITAVTTVMCQGRTAPMGNSAPLIARETGRFSQRDISPSEVLPVWRRTARDAMEGAARSMASCGAASRTWSPRPSRAMSRSSRRLGKARCAARGRRSRRRTVSPS